MLCLQASKLSEPFNVYRPFETQSRMFRRGARVSTYVLAEWEMVVLPLPGNDIDMSNDEDCEESGLLAGLDVVLAPPCAPAPFPPAALDDIGVVDLDDDERALDLDDDEPSCENERVNEMLQRLRSGLESEALRTSGLKSELEVILLEFHFKHLRSLEGMDALIAMFKTIFGGNYTTVQNTIQHNGFEER